MNIKEINKIILDVSFKHKLSHLSSCLTAAPIIKEIYETKRPEEKFILSNGHAGVGLYAVIQEYFGVIQEYFGDTRADKIFEHHGIHPDRCSSCHLDCSTGSLGQGLPIALGMALADPTHDVYCLISDGECAEGSIWEALRIKTEQKANNLKVYANINGNTAYRQIDAQDLASKLKAFDPEITNIFSKNPGVDWLQGVAGHYAVMDEARYKEALELLT